MKIKFYSELLVVSVMALAVSSLYSCKDYDDEFDSRIVTVETDNLKLHEICELQQKEINNLKDKIGEVKADCEKKHEELLLKLKEYATKKELADSTKKYAALIATNKANIQRLESDYQAADKLLADRITVNETNITKILTWISTYEQIINTTKSDLAALKVDYEANVVKFTSKVQELTNSVAKAQGLAERDSVRLDEYKKLINKLELNDGKLNKRIDSLAKVTANLQTELATAKQEAKNYTDAAIANVTTLINSNTAKISAIDAAYKLADQQLQNQINDLKTKVNNLDSRVTDNTKGLADLNAAFSDVISKFISNISVQGAYNPMYGYFALPIGVKSNVLAAFYGTAPAQGVEFPTVRTANYVFAEQAFTDREAELLGFANQYRAGGGDCLLLGKGNAGKLYMTINPNTVDLSNTSFKLVNSRGDEAALKLEAPRKSSDVLTFGFTRSGVNNGFYAADATLTEENVEAGKLRLDLMEVKDALKDLVENRRGADMSKIAKTLYHNVNDVADANAIEATWTDFMGEHSTYSDYEIAAVAVKPLSFNFMKDYHIDNFWGIQKSRRLINKVINKFDEMIPAVPTFEMEFPRFDTLTITELSPSLKAKFRIVVTDDIVYTFSDVIPLSDVKVPDTTLPLQGQIVMIPSRNVTAKKADGSTVKIIIPSQGVKVDGVKVKEVGTNLVLTNYTLSERLTFPVEFTYDMRNEIEEIYGQLNDSQEEANDIINEITRFMNEDAQKFIDDLNSYSNKVDTKIDEAQDKLRNKLNSYLTKLNNKLCGFVNSFNDRLQPLLLVNTANDFYRISTIKGYPTEVNSELKLTPTSYTLEMIAPAFKKYVAVTDVIKGTASAKDGDSNCVNLLKKANENEGLNKVVEGKVLDLEVSGLKSGYVYEITYSAVDFSGYIVNTKYYVRIK